MSGDEVEQEQTRTERLLSLRSVLQDLEAALARVALVVDGTDSGALADDLEKALVELDELGVASLMTHAESASVASDNIGTLLDDRAGVAALRNGLRVASRLIGTILETGLHDWWEGAEPEILIAVDEVSPDSQAFGSFAARLNGLLWSMNHAAFALSTTNLEHEELLPPVSAVRHQSRRVPRLDARLGRHGGLVGTRRRRGAVTASDRPRCRSVSRVQSRSD